MTDFFEQYRSEAGTGLQLLPGISQLLTTLKVAPVQPCCKSTAFLTLKQCLCASAGRLVQYSQECAVTCETDIRLRPLSVICVGLSGGKQE